MPQKDNAFALAFRKLVAQPLETPLEAEDAERAPDLATAVLERLKRRR